jgi:hypothetical protein
LTAASFECIFFFVLHSFMYLTKVIIRVLCASFDALQCLFHDGFCSIDVWQ